MEGVFAYKYSNVCAVTHLQGARMAMGWTQRSVSGGRSCTLDVLRKKSSSRAGKSFPSWAQGPRGKLGLHQDREKLPQHQPSQFPASFWGSNPLHQDRPSPTAGKASFFIPRANCS